MKRRGFIAASGSLVLAFSWRPGAAQGTGEETSAGAPGAPKLPGSLGKLPFLDGWIRIGADGSITVFSGKAELGQGIRTALIQVAAEELVVPARRVTLVTADTERTADEGFTAGSHSMQDSGTAIRLAAAQVRAVLLGMAAQRLSVPLEQLRLADGSIHGPAARIGYGELVAGADLHLQATGLATPIAPDRHTLVGQPMQRIDIPAKVSGGAAYVQDLKLDGMVHGRIVRPPSPAALLKSLSASNVERMPGVLKVVRDGRFIGVIAQREYQAVVAMRALAAAAQWSESASLPLQAGLYADVLAAPSQDTTILDRGSPAGATRTLSAGYLRPYQLHASIGPSCAVAQWSPDQLTVWTHSQGVFPLRKAIAELMAMAEPQVHCIHVEGSGCYGHNGADDAAADAALLARALPGRPVRVQWMREDEHAWEPFGPPMVSGVKASLDASGAIVGWQYEVWSQTHATRPGTAGNLLAGTHIASAFVPPVPKPAPQPEGAGDRNAIPLYAFPQARVIHHFQPDMTLRVSALRSLGAYFNIFSIESFMDELARAANADPVQFRLRHLTDERARAVIHLASDQFGWRGYQRRPGHGRGFAFARYKNLAAYCAIACEVEVWRTDGAVRIVRAVAAVDSGEAVNPDGIRNQIEGGIVQSASWTTIEEATFDTTRVTSRDWGGYPILRFPQVPGRIDVHVIDRPGTPFLGTGEASQGPTSAAIANAVADATGLRIRQLPLSRERLRQFD